MRISSVQILSYILAFFLLSGSTTTAESSKESDSPSGVTQRSIALLQDYLQYMEDNYRFMGTLQVSTCNKQEPFLNEVHGFAINHPSLSNSDLETRFRIGSITKTFTATMILMLVEEGLLALDTTTLDQFFPEVPNANRITVEMLLRHRSGIYSYTDDASILDNGYYLELQTRESLLERIIPNSPIFEPDTQSQYSNSNFLLLGYILEDVTGLSYDQNLQSRITTPLDMSHTSIMEPSSAQENIAASFDWIIYEEGMNDGYWEQLNETHPTIPGGAGHIMSTMTDATQFLKALFCGRYTALIEDQPDVVTAEGRNDNNQVRDQPQQLMLLNSTTFGRMTDFQGDVFGMGLLNISSIAFGHNGGIDGFVSFLFYLPLTDMVLAVSRNGWDYNGNDGGGFMLSDILTILLNPDAFDKLTLAPSVVATSSPTSAPSNIAGDNTSQEPTVSSSAAESVFALSVWSVIILISWSF